MSAYRLNLRRPCIDSTIKLSQSFTFNVHYVDGGYVLLFDALHILCIYIIYYALLIFLPVMLIINHFNDSCSKLLLFDRFSAKLV